MAFVYATGTDDPRAGMVEVAVTITGQTSRAIRVSDGERFFWLPKSKVRIAQRPDGRADVAMPKWLAKECGYV